MFLSSYQYFQSYALSKFRCNMKQIFSVTFNVVISGILFDIFLYPHNLSLPKSEGILSSMDMKNSFFKWENHGVIWNMSSTHQSWQYFNNLKAFLNELLVFCNSLDEKSNYQTTLVFGSCFSFFIVAACSYLYFSLKLYVFPIPMQKNAKLNSNKEIRDKMIMRT